MGDAERPLAAYDVDGGEEGVRRMPQDRLKSDEEVKGLKEKSGGFGLASCDVCHTRHTFSVKKQVSRKRARPATWESTTPSGDVFVFEARRAVSLKTERSLPETTAAPKCQTCHMQEGNHGVRTAGYFWR